MHASLAQTCCPCSLVFPFACVMHLMDSTVLPMKAWKAFMQGEGLQCLLANARQCGTNLLCGQTCDRLSVSRHLGQCSEPVHGFRSSHVAREIVLAPAEVKNPVSSNGGVVSRIQFLPGWDL